MAIEVGDAVLTISGDNSELDGAFNKIGPQMKKVGMAVTAVGGAITGAFASISVRLPYFH